MKFPSDIEKIILSYLTYNEIKTLSLPYDYYKNYLQNHKSKTKKEAWYIGNYNNINQSCFTCNKKRTLFPKLSSNIKLVSGRAMANTMPGKPGPVPTSIYWLPLR